MPFLPRHGCVLGLQTENCDSFEAENSAWFCPDFTDTSVKVENGLRNPQLLV